MTDTRTIGDNFPPEPTAIERAADLVAACNLWSAKAIADAEQAGRAQALVNQLRLTTADVEAELKAEREPHDVAIGAIRAKYRAPLELLGIALEKMKGLTTNWLAREGARLTQEAFDRKQRAIRAEEAALKAREEAARAGASVEAEAAAQRAQVEADAARDAASEPVERPAIRGELSNKAMTLHRRWSAEIIDEKAAVKSYSRHPEVMSATLDAIRKVASADARKFKDPSCAKPGIRFVANEQAV